MNTLAIAIKILMTFNKKDNVKHRLTNLSESECFSILSEALDNGDTIEINNVKYSKENDMLKFEYLPVNEGV